MLPMADFSIGFGLQSIPEAPKPGVCGALDPAHQATDRRPLGCEGTFVFGGKCSALVRTLPRRPTRASNARVVEFRQ